ncbi:MULTISPECIES: hypothetical protein [Saccharothrix]|uniref:hypothetical protein n=1 Tax=Saccharothrix TaxID=2071 RepID=UPI001160E40F|nr:hypothetical protein [Saccharothrix sp. CB00851]
MKERAVPLFVPPAVRPKMAPQPQHFPALPRRCEDTDLRLAITRVDHSGRVGDRWLIDALGWQPGDRHEVVVTPDGAVVSVDPEGSYRIDKRRHVFLPAAVRQGLGVATNDRVVLVARLEIATLTIHATSTIADLILQHYVTQEASRGW